MVAPLYESGKLLRASGLEPALLQLVAIRASQINRCAFCLALHLREAQALEENVERLIGLAAWREADWYSERERAALEWTEALTLLADREIPATLLETIKGHFSDSEIGYLTLAVNTINAWNRINVAFRTPPARADAVYKMLHPTA